MATTTFSASTLVTAYYARQSRYATDGAVQGARWRNTYSAELVGILGIPSLANVAWTGKIITAASLTVTTRSLTKYDTIRVYGSNYNSYAYSPQKYGYEYVDTDGGYTDISIGTSDTGDHTVSLSSSNIAWLQSTLRDGKTYFCMYYAGDTATSSVPQSTHYYGCNAFALSITYADAKSEIDSVTNAAIGSATTLTWTNYATTGRTCKVRFTLGNADSGQITASGSSYSYTLPSSWYAQLPTSTSGTATAYLYTYINGTLIGTETATFTASVPSAIVPSIGTITATKYNSNETVDSWDIWLQNYTQAVIAVSGCSAGTGANIASYAFSGQNLSATVTTSNASASSTSSAIQVSGDLTYTVKITDSRGRTATSTVSITVQPYSAPNISTAKATRCDSDGTVNTVTGEYGKAAIKYTYSAVGSNAITNTISYKLHTASTYTTVQNNIASWVWSNVFGTLDVASSYDVQGYVVDSLGNSSTYVTTISSISGIAFGLKNDRARFGGVTEKAGLVIDWETEIDNSLAVITNNASPLTVNGNSVVLSVNNTVPDANGNVNVSAHRAYGQIINTGWYRVLHYEGRYNDDAMGGSGFIIDFNITRGFNYNNNEAHSIKLMGIYSPNLTFTNECSKSATMLVDKIRWTYNGSDAYVDIHYSGTLANNVAVCFDVKSTTDVCKRISAESLQAVADAPANETILTTYTFIDSSEGFTSYTALGKPWIFEKKNGIVFLNAPADCTSASAGTNLICTLPTSWRPYATTCFPVANYIGGLCFVYVQTDGKVYLYTHSAISSARNCAFSGSWIAYN